ELTEAGRIALAHADAIFTTGEQLEAILTAQAAGKAPLRIGAQSTLSRNFQMRFLAPLVGDHDQQAVLRSGNAEDLIQSLMALDLDIVLANEAPRDMTGGQIMAHRIADQAVRLHGTEDKIKGKSLSALLAQGAFILPNQSEISTGFRALADGFGAEPHIAAEVDDMAMVRLLAREGAGIAVAPSVVLTDELALGLLVTAPYELGLTEHFFALTARRKFPHPLVEPLLRAARAPGLFNDDVSD
ncbi:MAG: LysR family transcriptional regulator, partial [Pseudomonadota bacterium]